MRRYSQKGLGRWVVSDDKSAFGKCSSVMSDEEIIHQYSKMALRPRRKSIRDLKGGKTLVSRVTKKLEVPALQMINDEIYKTEALEKKAVFPVGPNIKFFHHIYCAKPISLENNECLEPETVRVNNIADCRKLKIPRN